VSMGRPPSLIARTESGRQLEVAWARTRADSGSVTERVRAARILASAGQAGEAQVILRKIVDTDPGNFEAWDELEQIHRFRGDVPGVAKVLQDRLTGPAGGRAGDDQYAELTRLVNRDGIKGYWEWRLDFLEERRGPVSNVDVATAHAALGDTTAAFDALEEAKDARDPKLRSVLVDPVWDPFRRNPHYRAIMTQIENGPFGPGAGAGAFPGGFPGRAGPPRAQPGDSLGRGDPRRGSPGSQGGPAQGASQGGRQGQGGGQSGRPPQGTRTGQPTTPAIP
jgi:hypothetical protein